MLTKSQIKVINKLSSKKYRKQYGWFVAEGKKVISELLESELSLEALYTTTEFGSGLPNSHLISESELKKISTLTTAQTALAVFRIPETYPLKATTNLILALDDVRDPGNLGTIIRLCDWYAIEHLVCSEQTVDCYNSKAVQASMGSLARVNISYLNLPEFLSHYKGEKYGAFLEGDRIYTKNLPKQGVLVLGNEANGISAAVENQITQKLTIPQSGKPTAESLNVATAAAILLSEFSRLDY